MRRSEMQRVLKGLVTVVDRCYKELSMEILSGKHASALDAVEFENARVVRQLSTIDLTKVLIERPKGHKRPKRKRPRPSLYLDKYRPDPFISE